MMAMQHANVWKERALAADQVGQPIGTLSVYPLRL
jgi:hypothetical protein